ncbi:polysaccharide deacetylase [Aliidongia dinghuensis]|uniref:Chitooligosaccharide deacetylase n=1 Tax=Aliidongia dinghuensis TaxID=1867774 RepID=A0A8J2YWA1_9PROT|nr:polysaccharide deacetylase [Aliidongia dinghuensis]GGF28775.1 polysaccharide deacetylase [Aliidongia dinghuensis]
MSIETPRWPGGARMAVVVTIDFNDIHDIVAREPSTEGREKTLSVWRYGARRGVDRVLDVLDKHQVRASWFVPGRVAEEHRGLVGQIHAAGHELASNGYRCEIFDKLDLAQQQEAFRRGHGAVAEAVGEAPVGFRSASGNWAPGFADTLRAAGIRWSSSWRGDDLPYFHEPLAAPRLVELPLHYELEDEPYFAFNLYPPVPPGQSRIASYRDVLDNWRQDFAGFRRYGLCYLLRLHPEMIGTTGRIALLDELLGELRGQSDNWFTTGREVADWWAGTQPPNAPGHPVEIFARHIAELPS